MTREELAKAIREDYIRQGVWAVKTTNITMNLDFEMLEIIREALEQEPCEDAVSRQGLLDAFGLSEKTRKYGGDHSGYDTMMLYEIQQVIEGAESVNLQRSGKWIPVIEGLPDLWDERYLVSLAWGGVGVMEYKSTGFHNYGSFSPVPIETVTAWMPLPEPYKAESEEA